MVLFQNASMASQPSNSGLGIAKAYVRVTHTMFVFPCVFQVSSRRQLLYYVSLSARHYWLAKPFAKHPINDARHAKD